MTEGDEYDTSDIHKVLDDTIHDLVADFAYYDRKNDESGLDLDRFEAAIADGTVTIDEMVASFRRHLEAGLKGGA